MAYRKYGFRRRSNRTRRPYRRSSYGRRSTRRTFGKKRYGYANVGGSHANTLGFRNRPFNPRRQNRLNWNASNAAAHYRSVSSLSSIGQLTPSTVIDQNLRFLPFIDSSFWTVGGGAVDSIGVGADAKIFIRGGTSNLRVYNTDTDTTVIVRVWCVRTTANGLFNITTTPTNPYDIADEQLVNWDPTVQTDFFRYYKVWKSYEFILKPEDVYTMKRKIPSQRIDTTQYNALAKRDFYIVGINSMDASTATVNWSADFNISFSTDIT